MSKKTSWIDDAFKIVEDRKGAVTEEDEKNIREVMKISNSDISVDDVAFKRHRSYL